MHITIDMVNGEVIQEEPVTSPELDQAPQWGPTAELDLGLQVFVPTEATVNQLPESLADINPDTFIQQMEP